MPAKTLVTRHAAVRDDIGELITRRPVPGPALETLNPFLFLNHHGPQIYAPHNRGLPFGPHPHRGFETVTFMIEGELAHRDTGGHESVIGEGGVQWLTAGSGLVHAEVSPDAFRECGGPLEILQLWINLPARLKMTPPRYTGLQAGAFPVVPGADAPGQESRALVHLIAGQWNGVSGPVESLTGVFMSTVRLQRGGAVNFAGVAERVPFLYVIRGAVRIGKDTVSAFTLAELSDMGDSVEFIAEDDALVLFGHADPIDEPVVSYGPFVMNTREEISQAIADYQAGKFGAME
jgi:redox-sensitive bicupin YhaK (pirin superfamily)